MIAPGIKRGTAELAVLSVLEDGPLHGYEMARRIEEQTQGALRFTLASLYPLLYRLEKRGWVRGAWETSDTGRRRRCYRLTPAGQEKAVADSRGMERIVSCTETADEGVPCVIGKRLSANNSQVFRLKPDERSEVIAELAAHLEETCEELLQARIPGRGCGRLALCRR